LANGQPVAKITLPESTAPDLVVAEDGVVFVGVGAWVTAVDAEGGVRWRESGGGAPLALAAPDASVLLVGARDGARWRLRGHEVATGRLLWSHEDARFAGLPKIDGRGLAYLRQGDDLVAIDPKTGVAFPQRVALGESDWEFAFAGPGRIFVVRRSSSGTGFLVVE
ncbi:MAG TPA: PQQ-binding-like beta-propeller repeat protein, partial [Planctomycetota bacterium]|nr:PQQ-binding-like beta-propeller repeat protein [Planctomycetota bacterium]